jgi:hypothetical protein
VKETRKRLVPFARHPAVCLVLILSTALCPNRALLSASDVVINEIMYHPLVAEGVEEADYEYVELYNRGAEPVNLSGWKFTDGIAFTFGDVTMASGEYLVVCKNSAVIAAEYGIGNVIGDFEGRLDNGGEDIALSAAADTLVDRVDYGDSQPWDPLADGAGSSLELMDPDGDNSLFTLWKASSPSEQRGTPGRQNSQYSPGILDPLDLSVVINEIAYHHPTDDPDYEYIELFNRGDSDVDLGGWQFVAGVDFSFPVGTVLGAGKFLVLCKNAAFAQQTYGLLPDILLGNYEGQLDNGGEKLILANSEGLPIDYVKYDDSDPWSVLPDGLGSTLECVNPYYDNQRALNWRASVSTPQWVHVERTGTATSSRLYIYLLGVGECLIDDVSIIPGGGSTEHVQNGGFENPLNTSNWTPTGNHSTSFQTDEESHSGNYCLHLVATGTGGSYTNSVNQYLSPSLVQGESYKLSFWAKHLSGEQNLYSRLSGNGMGGNTDVLSQSGQGSPGRENTVRADNIPPLICEPSHSPQQPSPTDPVIISAKVKDDSAVAAVSLYVNLGSGYQEIPMHDDGAEGDLTASDGVYSAKIDPLPAGTLVRYKFSAQDDLGSTATSPEPGDPTPNFAYCVEQAPVASNFPVYHILISSTNLQRLDNNPSSNDYVEATFVHEGTVYDGISVRYRGAWARSWPKKAWKIKFNKGRYFKDQRTINLNSSWRDPAFMREKLAYDVFKWAGIPYCETEFVRLQLNGQFWGIFVQIEQPDKRYMARNNRPNGALYKANPGDNNRDERVFGSYEEYVSAYGKHSREWEPYDDLITFIEQLNAAANAEQFLKDSLNVDAYASYMAANACIMNWDQFARNHYDLRDTEGTGKWEQAPWDLDRTMGDHWDGRFTAYDLPLLAGDRDHTVVSGWWNRVVDKFLSVPGYRALYYQRLGQFLATFYTEQNILQEIDYHYAMLADEVAMDRAKWGGGEGRNLATGVNELKSFVRNRIAFIKANLPSAAPPDRPTNLLPPPGTVLSPDSVRLFGSKFSDPDPLGTHAATEWQVREYGRSFLLPTWYGISTTDKTSVFVPGEVLSVGKRCFWRVRYQDEAGLWSEWSEPTWFDTSENLELFSSPHLDLTPQFNADVIWTDEEDLSQNSPFDTIGNWLWVSQSRVDRQGWDSYEGLPDDRSIGSFLLGEYTGPNCILLSSKSPQPTIALGKKCMHLSFLAAAANGDAVLDVILHYADGQSARQILIVPDWFKSSDDLPPGVTKAASSLTRYDGSPHKIEDLGPNLYSLSVLCDPRMELSSVTLSSFMGPSSGTPGIFAITYDELTSLPVIYLSRESDTDSLTADWDTAGRNYRLLKRESLAEGEWVYVSDSSDHITIPPWSSGPLNGMKQMFLRLELAVE